MSSKILQLPVGSRDLSRAETKIYVAKTEQIHKMTTIFIQKDNLSRTIDIFLIRSALQSRYFFLSA